MKAILIFSQVFLMIFALNAQSADQGDVRVCVAGKCESGEMSVEDIKQSGGLLIQTSDGEKLAAESFMVSYNIGEREFSCLNDGYMFTEGCKKFIESIKPGNRLRIDDIKFGEGQLAPMLEFTMVQ